MRKIEEMKRDNEYLEIKTSKNVKEVLNIIDSIIAGKRFGELDSEKQMYLLNCQSKIENMISDYFTENDIIFLLQTIESLSNLLFSAKKDLENIIKNNQNS